MRTKPVVTALETLAARRPVFWSEADLQHELAWEFRTLYANARIRLERPFSFGPGLIHLDAYVEWHGERWGIELKYRTAPVEVVVAEERFELKDQSAEDSARYDFIKDITRLEYLRGSGHISAGIAILVTNSPRFWSPRRSAPTNDAAFRLHEGRRIRGALRWAPTAAEGSIRGRSQPLRLRGSYDLAWSEYSSLPCDKNNRLRFLAVGVE